MPDFKATYSTDITLLLPCLYNRFGYSINLNGLLSLPKPYIKSIVLGLLSNLNHSEPNLTISNQSSEWQTCFNSCRGCLGYTLSQSQWETGPRPQSAPCEERNASKQPTISPKRTDNQTS